MGQDIYDVVDIQTCFIDEAHFEVSRNLVDAVYPQHFFNRTTLMRLLHMNQFRNIKSGTTIVGHLAFKKHMGYVNERAFKNATDYLAANEFIEFKSRNKTITCFMVNVAPLYDPNTKSVIHPRGIRLVMNARNQRKSENDFIMVPNVIVDAGLLKDLSLDEIYLLLKLYRYNFLEVFGGIDFSVIRRENSRTVITETVCEDIYMTQYDFTDGLSVLQAKGLVTWVSVIVGTITIDGVMHLMNYVCDENMFTGTWLPSYSIIEVLRPYYQPNLS